MFCKNCGAEMDELCPLCTQCGNDPNIKIGKEIKREKSSPAQEEKRKSRILAGILQIVFPFFALGRLYLGNYHIAMFEIIISLSCFWTIFPIIMFLPIGVLLPIYDGIRILKGRVPFDAQGRPLK